jgi:hypothetical protein
MSLATRVPRVRRAILRASAATRKVGLRAKEACPTQGSSTVWLGSRTATAEEAFLFYLRKKAVDGNEAAQERLEEIQAFRRVHDPDLGPEGITTIVRVIVSPDNPNHELQLLKMAVKLYRFQPHAQIKLEPWLVQLALDRLGDRRLNATEQATVVEATRTPGKVRWPDWWET